MQSDREALIAGIAADPDNDLRRLVFADWLDDHGEPERAEFVRLCVSLGTHPDPEDREGNKARAEALFDSHWREWFAPFIAASAPGCDVANFDPVLSSKFAFRATDGTPAQELFGGMCFEATRGFIEHSLVDFRQNPSPDALIRALRVEPIHSLCATLGADPEQWLRASTVALEQLDKLMLWEHIAAPEQPLLGAIPAFNDPHLAKVRHLTILGVTSDPNSSGLDVGPLNADLSLLAFAGSSLAGRIRDLLLFAVSEEGIRELGISEQLVLDSFSTSIYATPTAAIGAALAAARFSLELRQLSLGLNSESLNTASANDFLREAFSNSRWPKLISLSLSGRTFRNAELSELARVPLLGQLKQLGLKVQPTGFSEGLRAILEAVEPANLKSLQIDGLSSDETIPQELRTRFGDRLQLRDGKLLLL